MSDHRTSRWGMAALEEAAQLIADEYRLPIDEARQVVRDGLQSGEVPAVVSSFYGEDRRPATPADLTDSKIDFGDESAPVLTAADLGEPQEYSLAVLRPLALPIEISVPALRRFASAILGEPADRAIVTAAARTARRPGRPRLHAWDQLIIAIGCRVVASGLPPSRSALVNEAKTWFAETTGEIPDDKDLRGLVDQVWPAFERAHLEGACDLRPIKGGAN